MLTIISELPRLMLCKTLQIYKEILKQQEKTSFIFKLVGVGDSNPRKMQKRSETLTLNIMSKHPSPFTQVTAPTREAVN